MDKLLPIQLIIPDPQPRTDFANHTTLLSGGHQFKSLVILGFVDPGSTKHPSIGHLFSDISPINRRITIELATVLPEMIPTLDGRSETVLELPEQFGSTCLCLSNRMTKGIYSEGAEHYHAIFPRTTATLEPLVIRRPDGRTYTPVLELLRTVAAMRFELEAIRKPV